MSELLRALGALAEGTGAQERRLAALLDLPAPADAAQHTELFVLQLPPYASIYLGAEGLMGGEARGRIAGFWRALGLRPPVEPDHLTVLLALYAALAEREMASDGREQERWRHARRALFWEHLASWLVPYLERARVHAGPTYRRWAEILHESLSEEAARLGAPSLEPLHFRAAPPPLQARELAGDGLTEALLTPVRSGLILTRSDLGRLARVLGLGLRLGERRFILRQLLGQDAAGVLDCLHRTAEEQAARLRHSATELTDIAAFWAARAEATASALPALRPEAHADPPLELEEMNHA